MTKFEERPYSRYQVSKKYGNGVIFVVQGDTIEEMMEGIQETKKYLKKEDMLVFDDPPPARQDEDYSQDPADYDPSWCPKHRVTMKQYSKERDGKMSMWYSHKDGDNWCKGK